MSEGLYIYFTYVNILYNILVIVIWLYWTDWLTHLALLSCSYLPFHSLASFFFFDRVFFRTLSCFSRPSISACVSHKEERKRSQTVYKTVAGDIELPFVMEFTRSSGENVSVLLSNTKWIRSEKMIWRSLDQILCLPGTDEEWCSILGDVGESWWTRNKKDTK